MPTKTNNTDTSASALFEKKIIIFVGIVAAFFAGASAWIFYGQLREMQTEQRPWVYAAHVVPAGRISFEVTKYFVPLRAWPEMN